MLAAVMPLMLLTGGVYAQEDSEPLEEVLVSGEQPGPGLWKVTHGTHVLWLISNVSPAPKDMTWRSRQVESIVAEADVILSGIDVSPNIGFFRGMRYLRALLRARFNPDKAVLKDLLSAQDYARWRALRQEYLPRAKDDIEEMRPVLLAFMLYGKAIEEAGLTEREPTARFVFKSGRKYRVPSKTTQLKVDVGNPGQLIKDFTQLPRATELACLIGTLDRLEAEIAAMKQRANAWAVGDIEAFKQLPKPQARETCAKVFTNAPGIQSMFGTVLERYTALWLSDAESALAMNEVSVGLLSLDDILRDDGLLAKLRARGYTVESPPP